MNLKIFKEQSLFEAMKSFFQELNVPISEVTEDPANPEDIVSTCFNETNEAHSLIDTVYFLGMVNERAFDGEENSDSLKSIKASKEDYDGLLIFGIQLKNRANGLKPTRSQLAEITRLFNREYNYTPVTLIFKYGEQIAFANSERLKYKQEWREGEKVGKVTMLKDVNVINTHAAHLKILSELKIDTQLIKSFSELYKFWQTRFSLQALNDQFYADLQEWFYYASQNIKLPFKPDYVNEKENIKNFLVRLLARTMFCWFVKEKGLIKHELLELTDWQKNRYKLTQDVDDKKFLKSNSYYRGILQNIFFNALNQKEKKSIKDFAWTTYFHPDFDIKSLTEIPYLNGGIFDKLDEDNAKESIEDSVLKIPNYLFYGIEQKEEIKIGRGAKARTEVQTVEHKGLNGILKSYKFTLDENTPFEEDIALDPEMLGLVFENLLAELDPNLEESTIKSIRKQTGSYYTPRKVIFEMVNDSLNLYLSKFIQDKYPAFDKVKERINNLVYFNQFENNDSQFAKAVVQALDKYKVLDPACGSGAFPMGMLHRIVDLLKLVDEKNEKWIELKLQNVDQAQKQEFKKVLTGHLDDYGRKLGIIRDSIYGIDIQPLAVQITKLRFFISLLIDQKPEKGIAPMPNIETKIICADSLKNIQADLFSSDAIEKLIDARNRYYQPDISLSERKQIADEIINILDTAFPSFSFQVTGKRIPGQNKELIRHWFTHGTLAAPFFNMDFFYPELKESGGFDCVIGNPPYGGTKISDEVRNALNIESKDPYGAFIARFLNAHNQTTPLKHGGVLAYIVSDTFMTIKSHLKLRKHLMQNYVHKMLRVHPDTFRATVNTVIMVAERNTQKELDENHICLMADMTNISIHDNYEHFVEVLNQTKGVDFESAKAKISNEEYAIYYYPQSLIKNNTNLPFFVSHPSLFVFQKDISPQQNKSSNEPIKYYLNNNLKLFRIGETYTGSGKNKSWNNDGIFKVISGIKTGNNSKYLKEHVSQNQILDDLAAIGLNLTHKENGIKGSKHYVSFEMGKSSDSDAGLLPNYFQSSDNIYIDWSAEGVAGMKNEAHSDLANKEFRFLSLDSQISFSTTGQYAPTFRIATGLLFLNKASRLFINYNENQLKWLGFLNSKLFRFFSSNFSNHSVEFGIEDLKSILVVYKFPSLNTHVNDIIKKQKSNPRYDYASHEQIEIDKLVYEAYGLNAEDVQEVENWYARRYPKLSAAQKANLRALGKSDDYLELYGLK